MAKYGKMNELSGRTLKIEGQPEFKSHWFCKVCKKCAGQISWPLSPTTQRVRQGAAPPSHDQRRQSGLSGSLLTGPFKAGQTALAKRYEMALGACLVVPLYAAVASLAAQLRVQYRLKLPDAVQLASGL